MCLKFFNYKYFPSSYPFLPYGIILGSYIISSSTTYINWNTASPLPSRVPQLMFSYSRIMYGKRKSVIVGVSVPLALVCSVTCWYKKFSWIHSKYLCLHVLLPPCGSQWIQVISLLLRSPIIRLFHNTLGQSCRLLYQPKQSFIVKCKATNIGVSGYSDLTWLDPVSIPCSLKLLAPVVKACQLQQS